jgi:hypothetical protein
MNLDLIKDRNLTLKVWFKLGHFAPITINKSNDSIKFYIEIISSPFDAEISLTTPSFDFILPIKKITGIKFGYLEEEDINYPNTYIRMYNMPKYPKSSKIIATMDQYRYVTELIVKGRQ